MSSQTIFVSVAAYCDPMLDFTVRSLFRQAADPDRIRVAVIDQHDQGQQWDPSSHGCRGQIRCVHLDAAEARGPCWARALAMNLYQGEDWFLQIDSHTWFVPGWDDILLRAARQCSELNPRSIVSCYPNPFEMVDDQPVPRPVTDRVLAFVVKDGVEFAPDDPVLSFECVPVDTDAPLPAVHVAGGCLFAPGRLVEELPYDPQLYFHGEEQAFALRAWTRGWDLWQIPAMPVYHLYTQPGAAPRPMHWSADHDARRSVRWTAFEAHARRRLASMLWHGADLGVYGLGSTRSLVEYAAFSGIDYAARQVGPQARRGRFGGG